MRNLIAALLAWFLPPRGAHRAEVVSTAPARALPTPLAPRPVDVIDADTLPLIRPYVLAHEQAQERWRQRERGAAAALATFGIDYPYGPQESAA
jgi:hypothetical protein